MSVSELLPTIQLLSLPDKERLHQYLSDELARERRDVPPLPEEFPPVKDGCPATRDEIEASRREVGVYTLEEIWFSVSGR